MINLLLNITIFTCLGILTFQDLKTRSIYWFLPILLFCSFLTLYYLRFGSIIFEILTFNLTLIVIFFILMSLYYLVKYRSKGILEMRSQMGLGDVLFVIAITPIFSLQNFIFFITWSTLVILVVGMLLIHAKKWKTIPLCGMQSLLILVLLTIDIFETLPNYLAFI